jgi:hypothetical protein
MPAISPMSHGDGPLGRPVQLLTISAWPLVIPSGRARETICHHEARSGADEHRPADRDPGRPRSRDYRSPRGELPSSPDPLGPAVARPAALARPSVTTRRAAVGSGPIMARPGRATGRWASRPAALARLSVTTRRAAVQSRSTQPGRISAGSTRETICNHEANNFPIQEKVTLYLIWSLTASTQHKHVAAPPVAALQAEACSRPMHHR